MTRADLCTIGSRLPVTARSRRARSGSCAGRFRRRGGEAGRRLRERRVGFLRRRKLLGNGRRKRRRRRGARDLRPCPLRSDLHGRGLASLDGFGLRDRVFRERRPAAGEEQRNKDKSLHATLPAQCQRRRPQPRRPTGFKLSAHFGTRAHCTQRPRHYGIFIGMGPG